MKSLFLTMLAICFSTTAFSAEAPLLLDAACSYDCQYVAEMCYDGCWDEGTSREKYVDFRGLSLEAIEKMKSSQELRQVCLKGLPELTQWQTQVKFTKIANFKCQYFKH